MQARGRKLRTLLSNMPKTTEQKKPSSNRPMERPRTKKQTANILFKDKEYNITGDKIFKMWLYRKYLLRPP